VAVTINLVPFAGIALLWLVGALCYRQGSREDEFFATVFGKAAFLLLAMPFAAAAVVGAIVLVFHAAPGAIVHSATFHLGRSLALWNGHHLPSKDSIRADRTTDLQLKAFCQGLARFKTSALQTDVGPEKPARTNASTKSTISAGGRHSA
jgi:hypothetical protein